MKTHRIQRWFMLRAILIIKLLIPCLSSTEAAAPPPFSILHSFQTQEGVGLSDGPIVGSDGVLYGAANSGGDLGFGTVYKMNRDGSGFTVLHHFAGGAADGRTAYSRLFESSNGVLFGTTYVGGESFQGTLYRLNRDGSGFSILHFFGDPGDGANLSTTVSEGPGGVLFGVTHNGGTGGKGTIYRINQDGTGYAIVHSFSNDGLEGSYPYGSPTLTSNGALYGATLFDGAFGNGTLYRVNPDGSNFSIPHTFTGAPQDGRKPYSKILQASDGALYGTTFYGGGQELGTLFKINLDGGGYAVLFSFEYNHGQGPNGDVLEGSNGSLYGTTRWGGSNGYGVLYRVKKDGSDLTLLHQFPESAGDGLAPNGTPSPGNDGLLYGTTSSGGAFDQGTVYAIDIRTESNMTPPGITGQPQSETASLGSIVTLSVQAEGSPPLSYQWFHDGVAVAGATDASLFISNFQLPDAGSYVVIVSNNFGSITSQAAALTVEAVLVQVMTGPVVSDGQSDFDAAWIDYDGDGWPDLVVANGSNYGGQSPSVNLFYHNNGDGTFSPAPGSPVNQTPGYYRGVVAADFNNDGRPDIYVSGCCGGPTANHYYRNDGGGQFTAIDSGAFTASFAESHGTAVADFDGDGFLDVFVSNYGSGNTLFRNQGNGLFQPTTDFPSGVVLSTFGTTWADYNDDGRPDLFLANYDNQPNKLYANQGNGTFVEVSAGSLTSDTAYSIGAAWADFDNDGDLDVIVTHANNDQPVLYRNDGGTFTHLPSSVLGMPNGEYTGISWGDYDNDGLIDLVLTGSNFSRLLRNRGDGTFALMNNSPVTRSDIVAGAAAWADYDRDGFLDLFVGAGQGGNDLLFHNSGNANHWLRVRCVTTAGQRDAIGAKVRVTATINGQTVTQRRDISAGHGFLGHDEPIAHFGLGDATIATTVRIEWPSGVVQELNDLPGNQIVTVIEQSNAVAPNLAWTTPADISYGTPLGAAQLNATATDPNTSATVPGTFIYTPAAGTVLSAGAGRTLRVLFVPDDTVHYASATTSTTINVTYNSAEATFFVGLFSQGEVHRFSLSPAGAVNSTGSWPDVNPLGLTFDPLGHLWVGNDIPAGTIKQYGNPLGSPVLIGTVATGLGYPQDILFENGHLFVGDEASGNVFRFDPPDFSSPTVVVSLSQSVRGLARNPVTGELYVSERNAVNRINRYRLDAAGSVIATLPPITNSGFNDPQGMVFSERNELLVANAGNHNILRFGFDSTGIPYFIDSFAGPGMTTPFALAFSPWGELFVADWAGLVSRFTATASGYTSSGYFPTPSGASASSITFAPSTASAASAPTISWSVPADITYGTPLSAAQLNASATDPNTSSSVPGTFVYSPAAGTVLNAGNGQNLSLTFTPDDTVNYSVVTANVSINVLKATPVLAWNNPSDITYGTALSDVQLNASASVPGNFNYSPAAGTILAAGNGQPLNAFFTPTDSQNYNTASAAAVLNILRAPLTVSADNQNTFYGSAVPPLTVSYLGFVAGDDTSVLAGAPALSTTATPTSHVGNYPIALSIGTLAAANYTFTLVPGTLTVVRAPLTIIADEKSKVYGAVLPALTAAYSGFVNGETKAILLTPIALSTTAVKSSNAGTYPITVSGATAADYAITFVNGGLTVMPAPLTITAVNKSNVYGTALPTLTATYFGFVNGDTKTDLDTPLVLSTTATQASDVGTYPITASGASDANYTITFATGTLTVTPHALTITAVDKSNVYGTALPTLTATYSGFVNGDTKADLDTPVVLSTTATQASDVGAYPITASGASDANYTITFATGTLTVTPHALTIHAQNKSKVYGAALPPLTAAYTGLVNGDTAASLDTPAVLQTTATAASDAGTYPITVSGATAHNYTITFVNGTLTVNTALLTIRAQNKTKTYGATVPALTYTLTGLVNGDTEASLDSPVAIACSGTDSSVVGSYVIVASSAADANYHINFVDGALNVTKAPLTIRAQDASKVYGDAVPTLTAIYTGFVLGETAANLDTPAVITTTATPSSIVGNYPITISGATDANYNIGFQNGTLTVSKAALTITADNKTRPVGAPNPPLTATYRGFVNGDTEASLDTPVTLTTTATTTSLVGTYPITAKAAKDVNYTITFVDGTMTVTLL